MPNVGSQQDAIKLYMEWYGKNKTPNNYIIDIQKFPKSWVYLGYLTGIEYITDRFGKWEQFVHKFTDGYYPLLHADPYRRMLFPYGNLSITEQGIISLEEIPTVSLKK